MSRFFSRLLSSFILAASCLIPFPVFGEQAASNTEVLETRETQEIVVTASRYEEVLSSVPANVSVITEKDIKNSTAKNIPDLLRNQPGILVNDITGNQRNYTVDLRGFGETAPLNTLVLVDGRRINQADLSGVDWEQISLDQVERIEIVRGGRGSVLYGDNAGGGVINIITRQGNAFSGGITGSAGSYDTYGGNASISGPSGNFLYSLSGSYLTSDGYRDNSDTEAKDAGVNLNYLAGDVLKLNLSSSYHKDDTGLPGALKESDFKKGLSRTDTVNPNDFAKVEDYYLRIKPEIAFFGDDMFSINLSYRNRNSESFNSFVGGEFKLGTEIKTISVSPQIVITRTQAGRTNNLTLGFDYEDTIENIVNDTSFPDFPAFNSFAEFEFAKKSYGYYAYSDVSPLKGLTLSAGYRYEKADFDFDPNVVLPPTATTSESRLVSEDSYTAGINYVFSGRSYVYFGYARSFRFPVLDEYFNFITNSVIADLQPQRADNYELGLRYYFDDVSYADINVFRLDTGNEIFFNPTGCPFSCAGNDNLDGETRRDGIELSFNGQVLQWMALYGSYTYTDARIKSGEFNGNEFPGVPNHKATFGTVLSKNRLTLVLNGVYIGKRPFVSDFKNTFSDQQDYTVFNAKIAYAWKAVTAFLNINNLTDKEYSEFGVVSVFSSPQEKAFYPSPERNFLAGVTVSF